MKLLRPSLVLVLVLALAASVALSVAACGSDEPTNASARTGSSGGGDLTLRLGDQGSGLDLILQQSGALKGAPYQVKVSQFAWGLPLVQALAANRIDVGSVGNTPPIFGAAASTRFRAVAALKTSAGNGDTLLAPKGSDIERIEDLRGKTIALSEGSSAHGFVLNVLAAAHLTVDDVKLSYLDPAGGQAAFSSGKVDAWAIWQPQVSLAKQKGAVVVASGPPYETTNAFEVAALATLEDPERRAALKDLLGRLKTAYDWSNAHPAETAAIYVKAQGLSPEVAKLVVDAGPYHLAPIDDEIRKAEQSIADNLLEAKQVDARIDVDEILDTSLVP
jgi:sulfonate transport system substrate-binding protein